METRTTPCRFCGKGIIYEHSEDWPLKPTECSRCEEIRKQHEKKSKELSSLPFIGWDFKKGNVGLLKAILTTSFGDTKIVEGKRPVSLFIHGRTGLCKTRAVCEAATRYANIGGRLRFVIAHQGMSRYSELLGVAMTEANRYTLSLSSNDRLLILDDLGVGSMTDRGLEWLFSIVDGRLSNNYPIWITSNYDYDGLMKWIKRYDTEYAERIVRRIADMCLVIDAEKEITK